jgi:hypothetical protein
MALPHAILGFLDYGPMSGYDLKKFFDQSVAHFWSATQSHIYKALENLEQTGLVSDGNVSSHHPEYREGLTHYLGNAGNVGPRPAWRRLAGYSARSRSPAWFRGDIIQRGCLAVSL